MRNLGLGERVFRAAAGLAILGLYGALTPPLKYFALIGLVPLGTALTGFCPIVAWLTRRQGAPRARGTG
ncbi:MAG TPA: DUF2892 domain-containing protein [Gemmatimonadales bacterium]